MTVEVKFSLAEGGAIRLDWNRGTRVIHDLGELRQIVEAYEQFGKEDVARFGLLAALLAARGLRRTGSDASRSNVMRALDEYYFVFSDDAYDAAFERGLEEGIDLARQDPVKLETEVWRRLGKA